MWQHYRKTFLRMQLGIWLVSAGVFIGYGYALPPALIFFAVMQVGALLGAMWAARLTGALRRRADALPLQTALK
jgi:hypothetical protein